jgi:hypothetical protein
MLYGMLMIIMHLYGSALGHAYFPKRAHEVRGADEDELDISAV